MGHECGEPCLRVGDRQQLTGHQYYEAQKKASTACSFNGNAATKTPSADPSKCSPLLREAGGVKGTGTVTSAPSGSGRGSGAADVAISAIQIGSFRIGAAMGVAFLGGLAMVLV